MTSLTATYAQQESEASLLIEQQDYDDYTGTVTKYSVSRILANLIYGVEYEDYVACGVEDDSYETVIDVYPTPPDLAFSMHLTSGTLSDAAPDLVERTEIIHFRLDAPALSYPGLAIVSLDWLGEVYDAAFGLIGSSSMTINDGALKTSVPVYGSARVTYTTVCASYNVTVTAREDSLENKYSCVAYGVYSGGVDWLEIDPPYGAEDSDGDCLGVSADVFIDPGDDPGGDPSAEGENRHMVLDYCTMELISDTAS